MTDEEIKYYNGISDRECHYFLGTVLQVGPKPRGQWHQNWYVIHGVIQRLGIYKQDRHGS